MTAHYLFTQVSSGDAFGRPLAEDNEVASRKLQEAISGDEYTTKFPALLGEPSLYESISAHGVTTPVTLSYELMGFGTLSEPYIFNGHHRVVAAYDIDPNMLIEVQYHQNYA